MLKDHNAVTPVRLKPAAPRSRVKLSTTEPLHSLVVVLVSWSFILILLSSDIELNPGPYSVHSSAYTSEILSLKTYAAISIANLFRV